MGIGPAIGAAVGLLSAGATALKVRAQNKATQQAAQTAQREQQMAFQRQAMQTNQANQRLAALDAQMKADAERRQAASVFPTASTSPSKVLAGLDTIATSPLGDTSEATVGRRKLLGN